MSNEDLGDTFRRYKSELDELKRDLRSARERVEKYKSELVIDGMSLLMKGGQLIDRRRPNDILKPWPAHEDVKVAFAKHDALIERMANLKQAINDMTGINPHDLT